MSRTPEWDNGMCFARTRLPSSQNLNPVAGRVSVGAQT